MITISKSANLNYLAKIVKLKNVKKHPNADRLQTVTIDFQNVITGMDAKDGDVYVYFPLESCINLDFLAATSSFRDATKNAIQDSEKPGFFEDNGRVKAMKLRGEKSMGYIVPVAIVEQFVKQDLASHIGEEFDMAGEIVMVKKYVTPTRGGMGGNAKVGKKPRISRMIDGQVHLHVDTSNFRKEAWKVKPDDHITITYKVHGTSFWVANVMVKRKLKLYEKFLRRIGLQIQDTEYDHVYGSRKVVKNEHETSGTSHFYSYDLWQEIKENLKDYIPKGFTVYGECVGYLKSGKTIQPKYDYGCRVGENKVLIYRITFTNADGLVYDLSSQQIRDYCDAFGLQPVHFFYSGKAKDLYPDLLVGEEWHREYIERLEKDYNDKDCFICGSGVPEEGIVIRKEGSFSFEAYKLKSFRFMEYETKLMDEGVEDIEENAGIV